MKFTKLILAALLFAAASSQARTLSPEEAISRVLSDSQSQTPHKAKAAARSAQARRLVRTTTTVTDNQPAVYAFDLVGQGDGFMIVSADDLAYPLLGYSDSGSLDGQIPPQLEWLLSEYAAQIEYAREHNVEAKFSIARTTQGREPIAPMIQTSWDQGDPYNLQCPTYGTEPTYTGCVATAMAQVMNYFQYPEKGRGSISYNAASIQKRLSIDFSLRKFDWANMIRTYKSGNYTDAQAAAVAYLMKACGYAVKMDYGVDSSGALSMAVPDAFVRFFNYDPNILHEIRALYTASEWEEKIYNNLRDCGPIMYGGGSMIGGGHSFICDGYDGNGYFHFNWGWTGMSDGYFSLDALNPYALGAGGGGGGGYNFTQDAVFGIQPPTGAEKIDRPKTLVQHGSLAAFYDEGKIKFQLYAESSPMWVNYNNATLHLTVGAKIEKPGDNSFTPIVTPVTDHWFELAVGYATGTSMFDCSFDPSELNLPDGAYKVSIVIRHEGENEYIPVQPCSGYSDFVYMTKTGNDYKIDVEDCWRLDVAEAHIVGEMYYGLVTKFHIEIENTTPIEMSRGFAPCFLTKEGDIVMLGESVFITVKPGETVVKEYTSPIYQLSQYFSISQDTELVFTLFDESTYNLWSDDLLKVITVHPNPGLPTMDVLFAPAVTNAKSQSWTTYTVDDPSDIQVSCSVSLKKGVFGYPLYACLVSADGSGLLQGYSGDNAYIDMENPTYNFTTTISCPEIERGQNYLLMMGYAYGGQLIQVSKKYSTVKITGSAGIDDITVDSDDDQPVEYYNLQGIRVDNPTSGVYITRQGRTASKILK